LPDLLEGACLDALPVDTRRGASARIDLAVPGGRLVACTLKAPDERSYMSAQRIEDLIVAQSSVG